MNEKLADGAPCRYLAAVKRRLVPWLILGALLLASVAWWHYWREHRYDQFIVAAARRYQIDPALVKAVIWQESQFDPTATGRAGEIGLMQICAPAAREWADAERLKLFVHQELFDPRKNILAGSWYLAKLLKRYPHADDPIPYALADYNAGRGNVLRWNQGAAAANSAAFLEQITFPGTRKYIQNIRERRKIYQGEHLAEP